MMVFLCHLVPEAVNTNGVKSCPAPTIAFSVMKARQVSGNDLSRINLTTGLPAANVTTCTEQS